MGNRSKYLRDRQYFIIEHPTQGTFREWDGSTPRFSWSGKRTDSDKAMQFRTVEQAINARRKFPTNVKTASNIRRFPDWEVVA
jgi:hypothetical protein